MQSLGERLAELRSQRCLTVKAVAEVLGVSPSTYREWEYGREIKGEPYMQLAKLYNVSLSFLLTGEKVDNEKYLSDIEENVRNIRSGL